LTISLKQSSAGCHQRWRQHRVGWYLRKTIFERGFWNDCQAVLVAVVQIIGKYKEY